MFAGSKPVVASASRRTTTPRRTAWHRMALHRMAAHEDEGEKNSIVEHRNTAMPNNDERPYAHCSYYTSAPSSSHFRRLLHQSWLLSCLVDAQGKALER